MTRDHKKAILSYIERQDPEGELVKRIEPNDGYTGGVVEYAPGAVLLHRAISQLGDEEYVRAYLLVHLVRGLGYRPGPETIEFEREYSIGRPGKRGKGARVDIILRYPIDWPEEEERGRAFLFIECKAPQKYDADRQYLKGQVFDLARQEEPRPRYGVYYTTETGSSEQPVLDRTAIVDLDEFATFEAWDDEGQPTTDLLPSQYGAPERIRFANVGEAAQTERPLRTDVGRAEFERLRGDLHNIVWGGGGTNNNDVFVVLVRLFLCRVYDENETAGGAAYRFQRHARTDGTLETPDELVERMSALFDEAAQNYLGYSVAEVDETTAFERKKVTPSKIAFVVEQLQSLSLTRNTARGEGDTLGEFFEGIVAQDFTQSKGQFFTHVNLVHFCLELAGFGEEARRVFLEEKDEQGRPRLPYVIDPSAGSGTFIVEAMKAGTQALMPLLDGGLTNRQLEFAKLSFGADSPNAWAREYIYGIEPNADLGLATKVNMILHGDGSTNVFVTSGLLPFVDYASAARNHVLGASKVPEGHPYPKPLNESFDFVFTNPPFSVDLSDEEKRSMGGAFDLATGSQSEALFVERWYQLLREGGARGRGPPRVRAGHVNEREGPALPLRAVPSRGRGRAPLCRIQTVHEHEDVRRPGEEATGRRGRGLARGVEEGREAVQEGDEGHREQIAIEGDGRRVGLARRTPAAWSRCLRRPTRARARGGAGCQAVGVRPCGVGARPGPPHFHGRARACGVQEAKGTRRPRPRQRPRRGDPA